MASHQNRQQKKPEMLSAIVDTGGNIARACEFVGINRSTHYDWLRDDPGYAEKFSQAEARAVHRLEDEARRRAFDGVEEPVFREGREVGVIRKYSDTLLIFLLKGALPDKYRDNVRVSADVAVVSSSSSDLDAELRGFFAGLRAGQELADAGDRSEPVG